VTPSCPSCTVVETSDGYHITENGYYIQESDDISKERLMDQVLELDKEVKSLHEGISRWAEIAREVALKLQELRTELPLGASLEGHEADRNTWADGHKDFNALQFEHRLLQEGRWQSPLLVRTLMLKAYGKAESYEEACDIKKYFDKAWSVIEQRWAEKKGTNLWDHISDGDE